MLNSRNKLIYQIKYEYIATTFVPSLYGHEIKNPLPPAGCRHTRSRLFFSLTIRKRGRTWNETAGTTFLLSSP